MSEQKRKLKVAITLITTILFSGCSYRSTYETIQHNSKMECEKQPPQLYDRCVKLYETPYTEYENERRTLLGKKDE